MKKGYSFERVFPTSPDGTDWGFYGDTLREQWHGVWFEARVGMAERFGISFFIPLALDLSPPVSYLPA